MRGGEVFWGAVFALAYSITFLVTVDYLTGGGLQRLLQSIELPTWLNIVIMWVCTAWFLFVFLCYRRVARRKR